MKRMIKAAATTVLLIALMALAAYLSYSITMMNYELRKAETEAAE